MTKFIVYATSDHGEGLAQKVGEYKDIGDMFLHIGMFKDDVVINVVPEEE